MEGFTIIDGAVAVIIVLSALLAYSRGLVRERRTVPDARPLESRVDIAAACRNCCGTERTRAATGSVRTGVLRAPRARRSDTCVKPSRHRLGCVHGERHVLTCLGSVSC